MTFDNLESANARVAELESQVSLLTTQLQAQAAKAAAHDPDAVTVEELAGTHIVSGWSLDNIKAAAMHLRDKAKAEAQSLVADIKAAL